LLSSYLLLNHRGTAHRPRHVENTEKFYLRAAGAELSGSIYTQVTDLETELNGLWTYDRTVIKVDPGPVRAIKRASDRGRSPRGRPGQAVAVGLVVAAAKCGDALGWCCFGAEAER